MVPTRYSCALSVVALLSFFHLGCDIAVMLSAATISIDLNLTDQHHNEIVNIARKACIASAIVTGFTLNYLGRMGIIVLGLFIHAIGVLFTCLGSAYQVVKTGRILMGLSFGIGMTAGPIYVAEIAPAAHRGLLISLSQLLLTTGEVFGYVGRYLAEAHLVPHYSWRAVLVIGIIPSFFIAAFLPFFFAESPCWLVMRGKLTSASNVMEKCGATESERRLRLDQLKCIAGIPATVMTGVDDFPVRTISTIMQPMWRETLAPTLAVNLTLGFVAMLHIFPPFSGADVAIWFGRTYFVTSDRKELHKSFLIGDLLGMAVRLVASVFPILMIDTIGRLWVLRISLFFTACAAGVYGGVATAGQRGAVEKYTASMVCLAAKIMLQGAHVLGLGAVPWVYGPEVFEFRVRAPAVGLAVAMNQVVVAAMLANLDRLYNRFDVGGVFSLCCAVMLCGLGLCFSFGKELRHVVLTEIIREL